MITVSDRQQNMIIYLMIRNGLSVDRGDGGGKTNKKDTLEVLYWEEGDSDTWMDYPYVKRLGRLKYGYMDGLSICKGSI